MSGWNLRSTISGTKWSAETTGAFEAAEYCRLKRGQSRSRRNSLLSTTDEREPYGEQRRPVSAPNHCHKSYAG